MIYQLYICRQFTGVSVEPDVKWPNMWRVRDGDRLSDTVNLSRAKDAAKSWAQQNGHVINQAHPANWGTLEKPKDHALVA